MIFFIIFDQINAAFLSIIDLFQKYEKSYFYTVNYLRQKFN